MVGIVSYGAYVPFLRLNRAAINKGLSGEKAIANFDEDAITMAVAAAIDCLKGMDRSDIDGLFLASTTFSYVEKLSATTVATATGLRRDVMTADFANSLRGGTTALKAARDVVKAGSARKILVVATDCRHGAPGSTLERNSGDGAAALLIGDSDVAADIEDTYSVSNEMMDMWRTNTQRFVQSWEERAILEQGYSKVIPEVATGVLKKSGLSPADISKVILCGPDARRVAGLAKLLGIDPKTQMQNSLFDVMGDTGTPYPLMLLVSALEEAKPGERILLTSYGNGGDALILKTTEQIDEIKGRRGIKKNLASKRVIDDYRAYLISHGLLNWEPGRRPPYWNVSRTAMWRETKQIFAFSGTKCRVCGNVQYPPHRICINCQAKDQFDDFRFSDQKAKVFSFVLDYLSSFLDVPLAIAVIDFEAGGRFYTPLTDKVAEEIKVGLPVEMTFRKLFSTDDVHQYFWKAMPLRD